MLARRLRRQSLSNPRRPEEIHDETVTLALDEVVEAGVTVVGLHERLQEVFAVVGKDEVLERFVIPYDWLNVLDIELDYIPQGQ